MKIATVNLLSINNVNQRLECKKPCPKNNEAGQTNSSLYDAKGLGIAFQGRVPVKTCRTMLDDAKDSEGKRRFTHEETGMILDQLEGYKTKLPVKPMLERLLNMGQATNGKLSAKEIKLFLKYTNGRSADEQKAVLRLFKYDVDNNGRLDSATYEYQFLKYFKNTDTIYTGIGRMEKELPENSEKSKLMFEMFSMFCPRGEDKYKWNGKGRIGIKAEFMADYAQILIKGKKVGELDNAQKLVNFLNNRQSSDFIKELIPHLDEKAIKDISWLKLNKPKMEKHFGMEKGTLSPIPTTTERYNSERRFAE